ncbi:hypothetical protein VTI74DRAFT_8214 [Chaetomium olivicolor]
MNLRRYGRKVQRQHGSPVHVQQKKFVLDISPHPLMHPLRAHGIPARRRKPVSMGSSMARVLLPSRVCPVMAPRTRPMKRGSGVGMACRGSDLITLFGRPKADQIRIFTPPSLGTELGGSTGWLVGSRQGVVSRFERGWDWVDWGLDGTFEVTPSSTQQANAFVEASALPLRAGKLPSPLPNVGSWTWHE